MDSRSRILATLYMEEPDIVPWFDFIDFRVLVKIFPELKDIRTQELFTVREERLKPIAKAHKKMGIDIALCAPIWDPSYQIKLDDTHYVDEWGRILSTTKEGDISDAYVGGFFSTPEKYRQYRKAPPVNDWRLNYFRNMKNIVGKDFSLVVAVGSIFELAMEGIGVHNYARILYTNPVYFDQFVNDNATYTLELGCALVDEGAEVLLIFDDYAFHSGPFISPKQWMKHVYPPTKRVLEGLHKKGVPVILHACGDIRLLMDGIIGSGYDGVHPLEATANLTLKEAKEKWGDKICLIGNTDINSLSFGKPGDVIKEVKDGIQVASPGGGYMLSSSHGIYHSCKAENVIAMSKTRKKYGVYRR